CNCPGCIREHTAERCRYLDRIRRHTRQEARWLCCSGLQCKLRCILLGTGAKFSRACSDSFCNYPAVGTGRSRLIDLIHGGEIAVLQRPKPECPNRHRLAARTCRCSLDKLKYAQAATATHYIRSSKRDSADPCRHVG